MLDRTQASVPEVMVVEDERITALSISRTLSRLGYRISRTYPSGEAALEEIIARPPDLVLMDVRLEGALDGIETAKRIPASLMVPVVFLSAYSDDETLARACDTKAYGYVLKPVAERELNAAIRMALERRATDFALRESEHRLRLALETAQLGLWEIDAESEHILYRDHEGWSADAKPTLVAERFRDFLQSVAAEDRPAVAKAFEDIAHGSQACEVEFRRVDNSGFSRWYRVIGKSVRVPNDRRRRIVGVSRDVTAAKLAVKERRESEQTYRDLISTIDGIIWEVDRASNQVTYVSDSAQRLLGYSAADWMSDPVFWEKHIHPDDLAAAMARFHTAPDSGKSYESTYRMIARDGHPVWIHEVVAAITTEGNRQILRGVMVDISNVKKAEADLAVTALRLAESEKRLASVLDTAAIGIVTVSGDQKIVSFNMEAERIFGYSAAELVGKTLDRLIPGDSVEIHRRHMAEFLAGEAPSKTMGDWRRVHGVAADGREIPLSANLSKVTVAGKSWMTVVMRDMTDIQRAEEHLRHTLAQREQAVAEAVAANKAKSNFLAVMSHELRTPLNAIIGFSELMHTEVGGPLGNQVYKGYLEDIHNAGQLLLGIINSILELSRIESGKVELKLQRTCLQEVWRQIGNTLKVNADSKGVAIAFVDSKELNWFRGDPKAVAQILINLVTNAIKFTPAGGRIEVGDQRGQRGDIALYVHDNGRGIPPDKIKDVSKPFFQVSDAHARDVGGVGLGLAICKSLVASMSGKLSIASRVGRGTRVSVVLPAWTEEANGPDGAVTRKPQSDPGVLKQLASLTSREREVLELLVHGYPNKTIAYRLGISPRTVETHRAHLMEKMKAKSLMELVRIAMQVGLAPD